MSRSGKVRLQGAKGNRNTGWGNVLTKKGSAPRYQCNWSREGLLMLTVLSQESRDFQTPHNDEAPPWHQVRKSSHEDKARISKARGQTGHSRITAQTRTKAEA